MCGRPGLLERRPVYYAVRITLNAALFAAGWTVFVLLADAWWQLVTAAYLAVVFTQTGFLGHDAGHRQIFRSRRANQWAGLHGDRRYRYQIQVAPVRVRGTRPAGDISSGLARSCCGAVVAGSAGMFRLRCRTDMTSPFG